MWKFLLLFVTLGLFGCPHDPDRLLKNPKLEDIVGNWESSGFNDYVPYALVQVLPSGNGAVILANDAAIAKFGSLSDFKFGEYGIEMLLTPAEEAVDEEPGIVNVSLIYGQLCVDDFDGDDLGQDEPLWCFTKSEKLKIYQKQAIKLLAENNGG